MYIRCVDFHRLSRLVTEIPNNNRSVANLRKHLLRRSLQLRLRQLKMILLKKVKKRRRRRRNSLKRSAHSILFSDNVLKVLPEYILQNISGQVHGVFAFAYNMISNKESPIRVTHMYLHTIYRIHRYIPIASRCKNFTTILSRNDMLLEYFKF